MVNSALRNAVLAKLDVTPQRIYQRIGAMKDTVPMSTEHAWYVLAAQEKIDVSKYLEQDEVKEVRELLLQVRSAQAVSAVAEGKPDRPSQQRTSSRRKRSSRRSHTIVVGDLTLEDPLLPPARLEEAKKMASRSYPLMYIFENSVREFIVRVMTAKHGSDWWDAKAPSQVRDRVKDRQDNEDNNPWHGKRGAHAIYYTDLGHLSRILNANWSDFSDYLPSQTWLTQKLEETEHSRNIIAHNNPLSEKDIRRIELFLSDWQDQMTRVASDLPS